MVVSLAGVFELHLDEVAFLFVTRYVGQPVVGIQLVILSAAAFAADGLSDSGHGPAG